MERGRRCGICECTLVVAMMVVGLLAGALRIPVPVLAATSPTLTLSRSAASYTENDAAFYVDDGIAISGFTDTIEGARVSIGSGFVAAEDNLSCSASGGISASYNASTGILTLTGTATASAYQTVLQSVRYSNASDNPSTAARVITVALSGSSLYNSDNGHYYEFVASAGTSWSSARAATDDLDLYGMQGYLATITSASENAFLTQKVSGSAWIGASDATTEGDWRWVTGPEAGNALTYTNWNVGEPNNSGDEDYAHMMSWTSPAGQWNDLPDAGGSGQYASTGYMVEYGGMPGDPEVHLSGTVTVTVVRVNDAPVIVAGSVLAIDEDSGAATRNVIVPSDPDSNVFTYAVVAAPSKGMASFPTASANQYRYTPNANANGSDSFTWRVYDGEAYSNVVTQTVTIAAVNDGPSLTTPAPLTVDEDTAGMITGLVVADIDVDETSAPNNTVQTSLAASHGTLTLFSTTGLSFASGDGTADSAMTFAGTLVDTNAALDALSYRPHADFNGLDACSVTISDLGHTGSGGARTAMRSVAITITPVNDAPVASSMSLTTREDTALAGTLAGSDVDSSLLSYSIATQPAHGNVVLDDVGTGAFTYTPAPDYNGPDAFTFKVSDGAADSGTATVTLTVTPVNDVPSFTKGSNQTVDEDSGTQTVPAWATSISAGPTDEAGQSLTFLVTNDSPALFGSQPSLSPSGALTFTPIPDRNGVAHVTVTLTDDTTAGGPALTTAPQTFVITVRPINDAPVCVQPPSLRGVSIAGAILAGDPGAWTDENDQAPGTIMLSFQWMRTRDRNGADPEPILGATSLTYMVSKADNGYFLTLRVTATDDGESLPATRSTVAVTRFVLAYDNADDLTLSFPDFSTLPGIMDPIGTRAAMLDGTVTPSFMVRNRLFSFLFTLTNAQGTMASWTIRLNGIVTASSQGLGNIAAPLSLAEGTNEVTVQVSSGSTTLIRHAIIFCDSTPPALTLNVTKATPTSIVLDGSVFDAISGVRSVTVDGIPLVPALDGTLSGMIPRPASSSMDVTVVDRAGNTATLQLAVPPATSTSSQSHRLVLTIGKDRMAVDGKTVLLDAVPEIRSGRTFLPIRAVVEQLGGTITWDAPTRTVTIDHGGHTIVLTIGSRTARVNGVVVSLETVPFIRSGRTFLPVRFIAENLGYEIEWDGQARTVTILW